MGNAVAVLFDRLLPESLAPLLGQTLGQRLNPVGEDGVHRICASGRFSGPQTPDLLAFCTSQNLDGALVVAEHDEDRVLFFRGGNVVGAHSTVLFELIGRVLYREELLTREDMKDVVAVEENQGMEAAVSMLPGDAARWALERRISDVATALCFTRNAHFVIVEGEPVLDRLPTFNLSAMQLALDGMRSYDEWRNTARKQPETPADDVPVEQVELKAQDPAARERSDDIISRIREAQASGSIGASIDERMDAILKSALDD